MSESPHPEEEIRAWASNPRSSLSASGTRGSQKIGTDEGNEVKAWANFHIIGKPARNLERTHRRANNNQFVANVRRDWSRHFLDEENPQKNIFQNEENVKEQDQFQPLSGIDISSRQLSSERKMFSVYFHTDGDDMVVSSNLPKRKGSAAGLSILSSIGNHFNATMPQLTSTIKTKFPTPGIFHFLDWNLRSIGQVYFCNNPVSGFLILIGLFVQSTRVAVHGLIALVTGNTLAILLGFDRGLIASGLFGYNSILIGLAIATFHSADEHEGYDIAIVIGTIITSVLSVIVFISMSKVLVPYKSPPLTSPFNLATHMFLLSVATMHNIPMGSVGTPRLPNFNADVDQDLIGFEDFFAGTIRGIGQVFLANNLVSGILILVGIGICSRHLLFAAFAGSLLGNGFAVLAGAPNDMVEQGLFGYNSSLTLSAIVLFYVPSLGCIFLGILGVILTVVAQHALSALYMPYGLPVGTVPFCIIALPLILIQGTTSLIIAVPLASITIPEDHLRRVNLLKDGFQFLLEAIKSSKDSRTNMLKRSRKASKLLKKMLGFITEGETKELFLPTIANYNEDEMRALDVFQSIDVTERGSVSRSEFLSHLKAIGLTKEAGLEFAGKAFDLMDLTDSGTLEMEAFVAFSNVSRYLADIRKKVANFFISVDIDGSNDIDFDELDAALVYLAQPSLTDEECSCLSTISGGGQSVNSADIVNFVTISTLRELIALYHEKKTEASKRLRTVGVYGKV
jgi:urea transporter